MLVACGDDAQRSDRLDSHSTLPVCHCDRSYHSFSIGLATATLGFWTTRIEELQVLTEDAARTAAQYPLTLYPKWMSTLLLSAIPVGFVNYIPSLYLLRGEGGAWVLALI